MSAPTIELNTGHLMPRVGLGTWPLTDRACTDAVLSAFELGYRLVDTAAHYGNESSVGAAIRETAVARKDLFVTTKLQGRNQGHAYAREGLERSLERLGLDYLDLFLIHWPMPTLGRYIETYLELVKAQADGLIRSVGVSNFNPHHVEAVVAATGVIPAVNQIPVSPSLARFDVVKTLQRTGSVVQAWSPLERRSGVLDDPTIVKIAAEHGVSPAQVALRWLVERDIVPIPQSATPAHQASNLDLFWFELGNDDRDALNTLDRDLPLELDPEVHEEF